MPRKPPDARVLPAGTVLCGWCSEQEARAEIAIQALTRIAKSGCWSRTRRFGDETWVQWECRQDAEGTPWRLEHLAIGGLCPACHAKTQLKKLGVET